MNNNFAYLLGSYFGDGHIDYKKHAYQFIIVSEDKDFLIHNANISLELINKPGTITKVKNYYKLVICSKQLSNLVLDQFCTNPDYNKADRYEKKGKLPFFDDIEHKKSFIKGLMDSDGWISSVKNGKYIKYSIGFKNISKLSNDIYELMKSVGLVCSKIVNKPSVNFIRNGAKSTHQSYWVWKLHPFDFISKIGFGIERKIIISNQYLKDRGYARTQNI